MTRETFIERCGTAETAVEFESQCLSIGREFLPPAAQRVLAGEAAEPEAEYWAWLIGQWDEVAS